MSDSLIVVLIFIGLGLIIGGSGGPFDMPDPLDRLIGGVFGALMLGGFAAVFVLLTNGIFGS